MVVVMWLTEGPADLVIYRMMAMVIGAIGAIGAIVGGVVLLAS